MKIMIAISEKPEYVYKEHIKCVMFLNSYAQLSNEFIFQSQSFIVKKKKKKKKKSEEEEEEEEKKKNVHIKFILLLQ